MNKKIEHLISELRLKPGANLRLIRQAEGELDVSFPEDYINFIIKSNGATGDVGGSYLQLWPIEDVLSRNTALGVAEYAQSLVLFGSDGGGLAYGFNYQSTPMTIVGVDYVSIGVDEDTVICGYSFVEFLEFLYHRA
jgi:hypothetical protein